MGAACSKAGQTEQDLLSDSLTEGSEDEENRDLGEEDRATEDMVGDWEPSPGFRASLEGAVLFRHATSRFLLVVSSEEEGSRFLCGRKITSAYQGRAGRRRSSALYVGSAALHSSQTEVTCDACVVTRCLVSLCCFDL